MGLVLIDQGVLQVALSALRRDAEAGQAVRGEIADEVEKSCRPVQDDMVKAANESLSKAVSAIYFDDSSDFSSTLWGIVRCLGGEDAVELLERDGSAAYHKYDMTGK